VVQAWKRVHVLLILQCIVERGNVDIITLTITQSLMLQGGLTREEVSERQICFGAYGAFFFKDATLE
jgi:hypothetical protein